MNTKFPNSKSAGAQIIDASSHVEDKQASTRITREAMKALLAEIEV